MKQGFYSITELQSYNPIGTKAFLYFSLLKGEQAGA
jgi:hypothetical protein